MNGTVYKRENGSWAYSIYAGRTDAGKQKRVFKSGFKTKRAADDAKNAKLLELKAPATPEPSPRTFEEFMREWFEQYAARNCEPKTVERYRQQWGYVKESVRALRLCDLTTLHLEREYNRLKESGGRHRTTKAARSSAAQTRRRSDQRGLSMEMAASVHVRRGVQVSCLRSRQSELSMGAPSNQ